jgi:hypothetical protein
MSSLSKLFTDLDNAVDELIHYTTPTLPNNFQQPTGARDQNDDELIRRIIWGLPAAGSLTSQQSVDALKEADLENDTSENPALTIVGGSSECMHNTIAYWSELDGTPVNSLSDIVGQALPEGDGIDEQAHLALFFVNSELFGPSARDHSGLNLFFNSIPTLQWSLCQPFLDIQVSTGIKSGAAPMSLLRFLNGAAEIEEGAPEFINLLSANVAEERDDPFDNIDIEQGSAGMEMFTAPQIMVPANTSYDPELTAAPIIDRFRPLVSVKDFSIRETGEPFVSGFRKATLSLILHDRSRMTELTEFLSMSHWNKTLLTIEWGWSHPHGKGVGAGSDNAYGRFINGLRKKEVYQVNKYSMSTDPVGQVNFKISLHVMASDSMRQPKITAARTPEVASQQAHLDRLLAIIRQASSVLRRGRGRRRNRVILKSMRTIGRMSTFSKIPNLKDFKIDGKPLGEIFNDLNVALTDAIINHNSDSAADVAADLTSALSEMDVSDSSDNEEDFDLNAATQEVNRKIGLCSGIPLAHNDLAANKSFFGHASPDPFIDFASQLDIGIDSGMEHVAWDSAPAKGFVTFAKLMAIFIGTPLINEPDYSDIQLIFHKFNNEAGACGVTYAGEGNEEPSKNIGEFLIEISKFKKKITTWFSKHQTYQMNLEEFVQFIINEFIQDQTNPMYGVSSYWRLEPDPSKPWQSSVRRPTGRHADPEEEVMRSIGASSVFKMPAVDVIIETKDHLLPPDNSGLQKKILKVHFIDRAASLFSPIADTITAAYSGFVDPVSAIPIPEQTPVSYAKMEEFYKQHPEADIINPVDERSTETSLSTMPTNIDMASLYRAINTRMPSVQFGSEGTAVKQLSINSNTSGDGYAEIAMEGGGPEPGPLTPTGLAGSGLPLRTFPTKLSLTTLGCPLMAYMQDIFIYMGTGTTIDNIYRINTLDHKMSPGKFETTVKCGYADAYGKFSSHSTALKAIANTAQNALNNEESGD